MVRIGIYVLTYPFTTVKPVRERILHEVNEVMQALGYVLKFEYRSGWHHGRMGQENAPINKKVPGPGLIVTSKGFHEPCNPSVAGTEFYSRGMKRSLLRRGRDNLEDKCRKRKD
jgi:hypothetical protein